MTTVNIFASFEFDKDKDLKDNFYRQAEAHSPHRIGNSSLHEAYPTNEWKDRAREAIRGCDLVIILIGLDTHNAPGVKTEVDIARSLSKPIFQVKPQSRTYNGVEGVEIVPWRWRRINAKIAGLFGQ